MIIPISIVIPYYKSADRVFLWTQLRETNDELSGLLEFPGGKIEANEDPIQAAVREIKEETGVEISSQGLIKFKNYTTESCEKSILLMVFIYEDIKQQFLASGYIEIAQLQKMNSRIPPANKDILLNLKDFFKTNLIKTNT